ncbi:DUF4192 domain-containing protein [Streptomyces zhihengii]
MPARRDAARPPGHLGHGRRCRLRGRTGARQPEGDGGTPRAPGLLRRRRPDPSAGRRGGGAPVPGPGGERSARHRRRDAGPRAPPHGPPGAVVARRGAGVSAAAADAEDDRVISAREAAALILGLQDRRTRVRAAQWMEGVDAAPALRLWRALARRCAGLYQAHAAAPLTLAGWVSWATGDEPSARVALGLALRTDPGYVFAQLLHQACNEGIDPETLRHCLRQDQDWPTAPGDTSRHLSAAPGDVADSGSAAAARGARATEGEGPPRGGAPRPLPRPSARRTRRGRRAAPAGASPLPRPGGSGSAASGAEPRQGEGTLPGGRPVPGAGRRSSSSARRLRRRTRRIASGTGRPAVGTPGRRHPGRAPRERTADGAAHARR